MDSIRKTLRYNLGLLWWLRCVAIAGQCTALLVTTRFLAIAVPMLPVAGIILLEILINVLTLFRLQRGAALAAWAFFMQLALDMLCLAGLLYFTGGAANPFTSLFILQVIIAAITLPRQWLWAAAGLAVLLYTGLMVFYTDIPSITHQHGGNFFSLHVQGMWVNFVLLAVLVAWFAARMAAMLRHQDELLAEARQMATLGAFATGAAHNLGTPLATMALIAEDIAQGEAGRRGSGAILQEQIARCKSIISRITTEAGVARAAEGKPVVLDAYVRRIVDEWQEAHPSAGLIAVFAPDPAGRLFDESSGFTMACHTLLDNAFDASPHFIRMDLRYPRRQLEIRISDAGGGIPPEIAERLGLPGVTTKPHGMGMGIYLAKAAVLRLGGTLRINTVLQGDKPAGTEVILTLPLSAYGSGSLQP